MLDVIQNKSRLERCPSHDTSLGWEIQGADSASLSFGRRSQATPVVELQRSLSLESFWHASLRVLHEALPHHSCSLMLGIDDFEPRAAKHHVAQPQHLGYMPATSLAVSRPFLAANPQVRLYTYSQIVSQDPHAHQRRLDQAEPLEEWAEFVHLAFWDEDQLLAVMSIRRSEHQSRFTADELEFLERVHPMMDAGIFRLRSLEDEHAEGAALQRLLAVSLTPSMLLDATGSVLFATDEAHRLCRIWNADLGQPSHSEGYTPIPEGLRALLLKNGPINGRTRVAHPSVPGLAMVIERLLPASSVFGPKVYGQLTFVTDANEPERALSATRALQMLSPSERRVALLVAEGLRNNQIAERLCRSRRTIESQLNSIYRKFNVYCRTQLVKTLHSS